MGRRVTPQEEFDRFAERLLNQYPGIENEDEFNNAFDNYMEELTPGQDGELREKSWGYIKDKIVFKSAGGKDLKRDRMKTAKKVVFSKDVYIKHGAQRVDLSGLDTKGGKRILKFPARVRGKIVYASKETITRMNNEVVVARDKMGRFASLNK